MSKNQDRADFVRLLAAGLRKRKFPSQAAEQAESALVRVKERFPDEPASNRILSEDEIDALMSATHDDDDDEGDDDATFAMLQHTEQELETAQRELAAATARANRYRGALAEALQAARGHHGADGTWARQMLGDIVHRADTDVEAMGAEAGAAAPVGDGRPTEAPKKPMTVRDLLVTETMTFGDLEPPTVSAPVEASGPTCREWRLAHGADNFPMVPLSDEPFKEWEKRQKGEGVAEVDGPAQSGGTAKAPAPSPSVPAPVEAAVEDGVARIVLCNLTYARTDTWRVPSGRKVGFQMMEQALDEILAQRKRAEAVEAAYKIAEGKRIELEAALPHWRAGMRALEVIEGAPMFGCKIVDNLGSAMVANETGPWVHRVNLEYGKTALKAARAAGLTWEE